MGFGSIKNRAVTRRVSLLLRQKPIIFFLEYSRAPNNHPSQVIDFGSSRWNINQKGLVTDYLVGLFGPEIHNFGYFWVRFSQGWPGWPPGHFGIPRSFHGKNFLGEFSTFRGCFWLRRRVIWAKNTQFWSLGCCAGSPRSLLWRPHSKIPKVVDFWHK